MLRFVVTYIDKTERQLKNVLSAVMNCEIGVPSDNLRVTMLYDKFMIENADFVSVYNNEKCVFYGQIDEVISEKTEKYWVTKFSARSLSALLLDNEAEPLTYINPSAKFIFDRHLKPFGIVSYIADDSPYFDKLVIEKGMTHWQVFENFCRNKYGSSPRINGERMALFFVENNDEIVRFGNGKNMVKYLSFKESFHRYKLISEVRLKTKNYGSYLSNIKNDNSDCDGIVRVRYINAASDKANVKTADRIIENSNANSYSILIKCSGCHIEKIGKKAVVYDEMGDKKENLFIKNVRYSFDKDGEYTFVELGKEKSYVAN